MRRFHVSIGLNVVLAIGVIVLGWYAVRGRPASGIVTSTQDAESAIKTTVMAYHQHDNRDAVFELGLAAGQLQALGTLTHQRNITRLGDDVDVLGGVLAGNPTKDGPLVMQAVAVIRQNLPRPTDTPDLAAWTRQVQTIGRQLAQNPLFKDTGGAVISRHGGRFGTFVDWWNA